MEDIYKAYAQQLTPVALPPADHAYAPMHREWNLLAARMPVITKETRSMVTDMSFAPDHVEGAAVILPVVYADEPLDITIWQYHSALSVDGLPAATIAMLTKGLATLRARLGKQTREEKRQMATLKVGAESDPDTDSDDEHEQLVNSAVDEAVAEIGAKALAKNLAIAPAPTATATVSVIKSYFIDDPSIDYVAVLKAALRPKPSPSDSGSGNTGDKQLIQSAKAIKDVTAVLAPLPAWASGAAAESLRVLMYMVPQHERAALDDAPLPDSLKIGFHPSLVLSSRVYTAPMLSPTAEDHAALAKIIETCSDGARVVWLTSEGVVPSIAAAICERLGVSIAMTGAQVEAALRTNSPALLQGGAFAACAALVAEAIASAATITEAMRRRMSLTAQFQREGAPTILTTTAFEAICNAAGAITYSPSGRRNVSATFGGAQLSPTPLPVGIVFARLLTLLAMGHCVVAPWDSLVATLTSGAAFAQSGAAQSAVLGLAAGAGGARAASAQPEGQPEAKKAKVPAAPAAPADPSGILAALAALAGGRIRAKRSSAARRRDARGRAGGGGGAAAAAAVDAEATEDDADDVRASIPAKEWYVLKPGGKYGSLSDTATISYRSACYFCGAASCSWRSACGTDKAFPTKESTAKGATYSLLGLTKVAARKLYQRFTAARAAGTA
jgi:hypothetical protein